MRVSRAVLLSLLAASAMVLASPANPVLDDEEDGTTTLKLTTIHFITSTAPPAHARSSVADAESCGVYVCINRLWEEPCQHLFPKTGECYAFMGWWNQSLSALGPDPDCSCAFYTDDKCSNRLQFANGTDVTLKKPGIADGLQYDGLNDAVGSMQCVHDS